MRKPWSPWMRWSLTEKDANAAMNRMSRFWMWLAWLLPRPLVEMCLVRAAVHATTGKWSSGATPDVTAVTVARRWHGDETYAAGVIPGGWNPWNKVVHRPDGSVDPVATNIERALRCLPTPWHPRMADKDVGEGMLEVDKIEVELAQGDIPRPSMEGASMQLGVPGAVLRPLRKKP